MTDLKPCHWGDDSETDFLSTRSDGRLYWVECGACGARGPAWESPQDAVAAWDARAEDKRIAELEAEVERLRKRLEEFKRMPVIGYLTDESIARMYRGGNLSRGTVPLHCAESRVAKTPVRALLQWPPHD